MKKLLVLLPLMFLSLSVLGQDCIKSKFLRNKFCVGDYIKAGDTADGFFGEVVGILRDKNYKHMVYVVRIPFWPMTRGFHMDSFPEVMTARLSNVSKIDFSKRNKFMNKRWMDYKKANKSEIIREVRRYQGILNKKNIKYNTKPMKFN